jgi:serine/threonine-protein kinase RsbT
LTPAVKFMSAIRVPISGDVDIVSARQIGKKIAVEMGFSSSDSTLLTTAISEVARNIVRYAQNGEIVFEIVVSDERRGVAITAADNGPGIADIDLAMQDGYSTGKSLGLGLPGTRRIMDDFVIESELGKGTTIRMAKWLRK